MCVCVCAVCVCVRVVCVCMRVLNVIAHSQLVIVIARVLGIYGSKPTRVRGRSPRTRAVYVAINP